MEKLSLPHDFDVTNEKLCDYLNHVSSNNLMYCDIEKSALIDDAIEETLHRRLSRMFQNEHMSAQLTICVSGTKVHRLMYICTI